GSNREEGSERMQVLRDRSLPDQNNHAFADLFERFLRARRLMIRPDARGEIPVEIEPAHQRGMAVDMPPAKGLDLRKASRIAGENAGKVHELRKPDHFGMITITREICGLDACTGRFQ